MKRGKTNAKRKPLAVVVEPVVGGGMKRKGIAQRLCDKRTELENLRRRTNAMRRRYSVCMKQWRKLLKAYEAECRKHCTPNPSLQGTGHLVDRTLKGVVGSLNQEMP